MTSLVVLQLDMGRMPDSLRVFHLVSVRMLYPRPDTSSDTASSYIVMTDCLPVFPTMTSACYACDPRPYVSVRAALLFISWGDRHKFLVGLFGIVSWQHTPGFPQHQAFVQDDCEDEYGTYVRRELRDVNRTA